MAFAMAHSDGCSACLSLEERAAVYVSYGWRLVPVVSGGKAPDGALLHQIYRDSRTDTFRLGQAGATEIGLWFAVDPDINLGVFPSESLCLIDIDRLDLLNPVLATPTAVSGRNGGGKHLYLSCDRVLLTRKVSWGHVNPAYLVVPGSFHQSGRFYEWLPGLSPEEVPFMDYREAFFYLGLEVEE